MSLYKGQRKSEIMYLIIRDVWNINSGN